MGVQLMKNGEHYKTYAYKDLEEWATVSSTGSSDDSTHNRLILAKRDRDGMTTEYITEPGDATKIAHDITRKATELAKAMRAAKKVRFQGLSRHVSVVGADVWWNMGTSRHFSVLSRVDFWADLRCE